VVINDFNLVGMPVKPHKTHTPLIVDANAVLTGTITAQSLQPVAWRHTQEIERGSSVQLLQNLRSATAAMLANLARDVPQRGILCLRTGNCESSRNNNGKRY